MEQISNITNYHIVLQVQEVMRRLYGDKLQEVILFGSYARGEEHEDSDMDFLIVLNEEKIESWRELNYVMDDIFALEFKHNTVISPHIVSKNKFQNKNNLFIEQVTNDGITL
ncbi:MAG: nucleotidyltransferase domain-containing protein [Saprospiraceae bacterium]